MADKNTHESVRNEQSVQKPNTVVYATLDDLIDIVSQSNDPQATVAPQPDETAAQQAEMSDQAAEEQLSEIESLQKQLNELSVQNEMLASQAKKLKESVEKSGVYLDQLTILKRDFESYRFRMQNAADKAKDDGKLFVIEKMLPVLNIFAIAEESCKENKDMQKALTMLRKQFENVFTEVGVKEMIILNLPFNPALAEAVEKEKVEDEERKGKVLEVYSKGYLFNDKVALYAKVKVGV